MTHSAVDVRVEWIEHANGRIRVLRSGEGPPVLFLHPAAGALPWNGFHERLARFHELVVPEHPGFGESSDFPDLAGMSALADHYQWLVPQLGLHRPALVGASLGGWLAAELACRDPASVTALALLGAPGLEVPGADYLDIFALSPAEVGAALFDGPRPPAPAGEPPDTALAARQRAATARFCQSPLLCDPSLRHRLERITSRCCVVRAANDAVVPAAIADAYAAGIGGAELVTVPRCGHALYYERPDEFADVVLGFLGTASARTGDRR
ncbi:MULTISPECIES: alpha/beta hydrolase [unclassified Mycobacterium]|uniref:alpha/beta fold hydrolase n=1 Tax=unclassified Mycobacterium TaxID=2642494 RepID=UPI0029C6DE85|nr:MULTISPECIES: alpha/beta hydrolase [unclassified Mycobacterium]